jgi:hypothetical protein
MTQRMTNHAQNALDAKLEQIEALVKCLEIKQAQEDLQALLEELKKAKDESLDLKTQIEVAERDFAEIDGKFKKYQASVDAGYDDKETLALRDSHGYELEEIHEEWLELLRQHGQVMQEVSELGCTVSEHRGSLEALKDGYEPHVEFESPQEVQEAINAMILCTEYRSGWSIDPSDLEAAQVRMTLAVGGPSIYLTADYDNGEINNAELSCLYYDDQAHTQDKQDVLLKFMSF